MGDAVQYSVRDPYGNVYGPATAGLLRQWVAEGRIIAGMSIGTSVGGGVQWQEASTHPAIADLLQRGVGAVGAGSGIVTPSSPDGGASRIRPQNNSGPIDYGFVPRRSRLPVVSLVLGVLAFLFAVGSPLICCCAGLSVPLGFAAAVTGMISLCQKPGQMSDGGGRTGAWIGLILGLLSLLITVVGLIAIFVTQWSGVLHTSGGGGL